MVKCLVLTTLAANSEECVLKNSLIKLTILGMIASFLTTMALPAKAQGERKAGETRTDAFGIEQVWVPAGCFPMGSSDEQVAAVQGQKPPSWVLRELKSEQPQHQVCLTQGYWIDKYEVTNLAYQAFIDANGYETKEYWSDSGWKWRDGLGRMLGKLPLLCLTELPADHPRVCVTWFEAEAYANWRGGLLPTEAQWEFAARGEAGLIYPWGNEWDASKANVVDSEGLKPVGSYPDGVSWVGAHDLSGNAMEWARDWLSANYNDAGDSDPTGPEKGTKKPERGGWWGSNPFVARTSYRHYEDPPTYQDHHIGFRIVSADE